MKNYYFYIFLFIAATMGCTNSHNSNVANLENEESTEKTSNELHNDTLSLLGRVKSMYEHVFSNYNNRKFGEYEQFFSTSLKALWQDLPTDYAVVDIDPWTWTQEPDSFVFKNAQLISLSLDTALVKATSEIYAHYDTVVPLGETTILLSMVREDHDNQKNWFVNDFINSNGNNSVVTTILEHNTHIEVKQWAEDVYSKVFESINNGDRNDYDSLFTKKLSSLFQKLPSNEIIFFADIWTGLQDFNKLSLTYVETENVSIDSASAIIHFRAFENEDNTVRINAIKENRKWLIDDFIHLDGTYSVAETARKSIQQ